MDEDSDASITIDTILSGEYSIYGITVNYQPLILIFCTILLAKILRNITTPLSSWVACLMTSLPDNMELIKNDIIELKKDIDSISITGDFPTHARLKRKLNGKETELRTAEGNYKTRIYKRQVLLEGLTVIFLELVPVVAVIYYRSIPILVIPEYYMWPVNSIVQFPTYIPGAIGSPVWALCSRQTLQSLFFKK